MWARNLLFVALGLTGLAGISATLLNANRIQDPAAFEAGASIPEDVRDVVSRIDDEFRIAWAQQKLQAADRASDLEIVRRLSLGLTGTVPSLEELRALEAKPDGQRVAWWLSRLLEDRRYADYTAERFARAFVGTENGPFLVYRRRRFVRWMSDRFADRAPYDEIVRELIAGKGLWTDEPSVNFLTVTIEGNEEGQPDSIRLAGRTTRAFLGMRIDCLQCHEDKLGNVELGSKDDTRYGEQSDFHKLAAFFAEAEISLLGIRDNNDRKYEYKYLNEDEETLVPPAVPFANDLLQGEGSLRERLARWVTDPRNKAFARSTVNRVWALMCGKPLVEPIDDIPLHGPFPPALETLASDFVEHDYDLRRLITVVAMTEAYQRSSAADFEITSEHEDAWAVFPLARLRPEQVAGSLIQSASLTTIDANAHIFAQLGRFFGQNEFVKRYGDTGEDEFDSRSGTVTQRLLMMNGDLVKNRTKKDLMNNAATRVAQLAPDNEKAVEIAYLCVLTRRPSPRELKHFAAKLEGKQGDSRSTVLEDLYWVLLNSTEFSWNH